MPNVERRTSCISAEVRKKRSQTSLLIEKHRAKVTGFRVTDRLSLARATIQKSVEGGPILPRNYEPKAEMCAESSRGRECSRVGSCLLASIHFFVDSNRNISHSLTGDALDPKPWQIGWRVRHWKPWQNPLAKGSFFSHSPHLTCPD
jgi:hypothetical protein